MESFRNFANSTYNREGAYNRVTRVPRVTNDTILSLRFNKKSYSIVSYNNHFDESIGWVVIPRYRYKTHDRKSLTPLWRKGINDMVLLPHG